MRNVRFSFKIEDWVSASGRYGDNPVKQTREQVVVMVASCIRLRDAALTEMRKPDACCEIECSAESFVALLIARRNAGYINRFVGLGVELVPGKPDRVIHKEVGL